MPARRSFLDSYIATSVERRDSCVFTFLADGTGDGESWTYADLHARAAAVAAALGERAHQGDRVLLMAPPGLHYLAAFYGCLYAGTIPVPAYPPSPFHNRENRSRLEAVAMDAGTRMGLVTADTLESVSETTLLGMPLNWIVLEDAEATPVADLDPHVVVRRGGRSDVAFLQYTSGSSGNPKGVMVTHGALHDNVRMIEDAFQMQPGETMVNWIPPYHDMGLIAMLLAGSMVGLHGVFMPPAAFLRHPVRWLDALTRFSGAIAAAPNFAYDICATKVLDQDLERLDLSAWRVAANGAEPVRASTLERFADRFGVCGFRSSAFYPSFGMAETTVLTSTGALGKDASYVDVDAEALKRHDLVLLDADSPRARRMVTCGKVPPGTGIEVIDLATGAPATLGRIGEFRVSGPHVTAGYWGNPEATAERFHGDTVTTGDLGAIIDGEILVTGRLKDLLILRGRNHYPNDIEQTAETAHPAVRAGNAAAFTVDDGDHERLVLAVEVVPAKLDDPVEMVDALSRAINLVHGINADMIVLVRPGKLPKTSSGKIRRAETSRVYQLGELEIVHEWPAGAAPVAGPPG